ncbi:glycosyltransferase family 39 protein [Candidatus Microgenomates bacterium]|nr:glycosyltransferase family 39 protein [Candidatus Microgenomates bacterium]
MNIRTIILLTLICAVSVFLNVAKKESVPACMNADEAAFGYNAYSIAKTGKDEYGTTVPLRLKSFGDYQMPLYSYLSVPFVATLGLTETSTRALNMVLAFALPLAVFFLSMELFKNESIALVSSGLVATSLGLAVIGRQAHEGYLAVFLVVTTCILFQRWLRLKNKLSFGLLVLSLSLMLFSYQSARIFAIFFFLFAGWEVIRKRLPVAHLMALLAALIILAIPDFVYAPARVSNLLFFKNPGLALKTQEFRTEGGNKLLYNKYTVAATQFLGQHLMYYSPDFLTTRGDQNYRFGMSDMPPVTYIEYLFFIVGLYFLIRKKDANLRFLGGLLIITPLAGSLTWAGASITRTLFILPLLSVFAGYGFIECLKQIPKKHRSNATGAFGILFLLFLFYGWNFYLNHYNKRNTVITAQQCGYRELGQIIKSDYTSTDHFYISKENGEPYIFTLFYLGYDPVTYQKQARLSAPDQYGFGQVESYDKFTFTIPQTIPPNSIVVGTPEDFKNHESLLKADHKKIRVIKTGIHEDFWVYKP